MNPIAIVFWAFLGCVGYLVSSSFYGAIAGLTVGLALSLIADIYFEYKGK